MKNKKKGVYLAMIYLLILGIDKMKPLFVFNSSKKAFFKPHILHVYHRMKITQEILTRSHHYIKESKLDITIVFHK